MGFGSLFFNLFLFVIWNYKCRVYICHMKMTNGNKKQAPLANNKPEFRIYKEGMTTNGAVTVLSRNDEPFDKVAKMEFYKMLGYTILPL